ncbi:MAG: acyl-CoA dehydrogenase family protein [Pseudomonadota bacterium]
MSAEPVSLFPVSPKPSRHALPDIALSRRLRALAEPCDVDGAFPTAAFDHLIAQGLHADARLEAGAPALPLLRRLAEIGRGDLSVGRIYEGHVNAVQLVLAHGTPEQRAALRHDLGLGRLFGVWNTDAPGNPLRLEDGRLQGAKSFASGVDGLHAAIVTAPVEGGRQMLLVPVAGRPVDRTWWTPIGMKASGSHVIDLDGVAVTQAIRIGPPDAYVRQPWFSAGAIRFAAVQVGGLHALLDVTRDHLARTGRAGDAYQTHRLADLALLVEGAHGWLERAARHWDAGCRPGASAEAARAAVAQANLTRTAIERAAMDGMAIAQRAIGCAGLLRPHPLERLVRDLTVYLRQPNPDGALAQAGEAVATGALEPGRL